MEKIRTYDGNRVQIDKKEALKIGLACGNYLSNFVPNKVYNEWLAIFSKRNDEYGVSTWVDLGFRNIFGALYSKYQRWKETQSIDAAVDIFGYTILASILSTKLGCNTTKIVVYYKAPQDILQEMRKTIWTKNTLSLQYTMELFFSFLFSFANTMR